MRVKQKITKKKEVLPRKNKLPLESIKVQVISSVKLVLGKKYPTKISDLMISFTEKYENLIKKYKVEDSTDLLRYFRITTQFKPALEIILDPREDINEICAQIEMEFDATLHKKYNQKSDKSPNKEPTMDLKYYCSICDQMFDIPSQEKNKIENSPENICLPKHHDKEMILKIIRNDQKDHVNLPILKKSNENFRNDLKRKPNESKYEDANTLRILSVGIDVGSSTSHLIFSRLTLKRGFSLTNKTNRFKLVNREIIYEGNIIFTPLLDLNTINIRKIIEFFKKEYEKAKITPEMVDTGAVIVTGETAKKDNASEIVKKLASTSGKFVSASAGPNFESMLGIMGSGMVEESKQLQQTIMNVDIGGGTSNIAIASKGVVLSTSCINVGGRLLGIDKNFKIWRIDKPSEWVMEELGFDYRIGDIILEKDVISIAKEYAKALLEVMQGPATSIITKKIMMTDDILISTPIQKYSFSGGVAELIYSIDDDKEKNDVSNHFNPFDDIGIYLAMEINHLLKELQIPIMEPLNKIRATVIGAGAFSLSVSGSTCYLGGLIKLPLNNIPVVPIHLDYTKFFFDGYQDYLRHKIDLALQNFSLVEGKDKFALYFKDPINQSAIIPFASSFENVFKNSIINHKLILIVLGEDGGKILGLTIRRETSINQNLLCLDELELEAGDWIDIGTPLNSGEKKTFPITKKSLVFNTNHK